MKILKSQEKKICLESLTNKTIINSASTRCRSYKTTIMTFKDFFKTTEALVVLGGLLMIWVSGDFWIIPTAAAYTLLNVPKAWNWLKSKVGL